MPMHFIFGLGNPGEKYQESRHNVGFLVVEELARQHVINFGSGIKTASSLFTFQPKFNANIFKHQDLLFAQPQTFMNDSGRAVRMVISYFDKKISFQNEQKIPQLWVVHDDLDLEVGKYKIQFGTGPKIHNGLRSIDEHLHTDQYWHVRIGVDGRQGDRSIPSQDYVLGAFSPVEQEAIKKVIQSVSIEILARLADPI